MQKSTAHRKVKYTKMVIRESLLELLAEQPLKQITVTSLCALADINRGTFYAHYADINDLVEKLEAELIEKAASAIRFERIGQDDQLQMFVEVFAHIQRDIEDYQIILLNPESSRCMDEILARAYRHHATALIARYQPISPNMIDYTFALLSRGCAEVIREWIAKDFAESPAEMAALINAFTNCGFAALARNGSRYGRDS